MQSPAFSHVDSWDPHECTAVGCILVPRTLQDLTLPMPPRSTCQKQHQRQLCAGLHDQGVLAMLQSTARCVMIWGVMRVLTSLNLCRQGLHCGADAGVDDVVDSAPPRQVVDLHSTRGPRGIA